MKQIPFYYTRLDGAFWGTKQRISRDITIDSIYDQFEKSNVLKH